jgi:hypothetical protein
LKVICWAQLILVAPWHCPSSTKRVYASQCLRVSFSALAVADLSGSFRRCNVIHLPGRPDELASMQAESGQPDADAVVHQHLHAVSAFVGEQVSVVRADSAEVGDDPGQRLVDADTRT